MLVREIDEPVFRKTREWLATDDEAYFYLVLDELHLQRGSAGTEVAYLLRMLLSTLGLDDPANRHKLRILCSSASLPVEGSDREQSLDYLWGLFGGAGLPAGATREHWGNAIVTGCPAPIPTEQEVPGAPAVAEAISAMRLMQEKQAGSIPNSEQWEEIAKAMGVAPGGGANAQAREAARGRGYTCDEDRQHRAAPFRGVAAREQGGQPHPAIRLPLDLFGDERRNSAGLDLSNEDVLRQGGGHLAQYVFVGQVQAGRA
eukprot:gene30105-33981_t